MWPPRAVATALGGIDVGEGRRTPTERLHVTLRFLGALGDGDRHRLVEVLAPVVGREPPPVAQLAATTATFGRHVLHVPVAGLDAVAAAVGGGVERAVGRSSADDNPFVGHLTVARSRGRSGAADLRRVAGGAVPDAAREPWAVSEVTLVASAAGRYEVVARFPTA